MKVKTTCKLNHVPYVVSGQPDTSVKSVVVEFVKFASNHKHGFAQIVIKGSNHRVSR